MSGRLEQLFWISDVRLDIAIVVEIRETQLACHSKWEALFQGEDIENRETWN